MKKLIPFLLLCLWLGAVSAQVYKTSTGSIRFFSKTPAENIEAGNNQVAAAIDSKTGKVQFSVSINNFQFAKSNMQKHFQENYMETAKYPKSTFTGSITNNQAVKYGTDGSYQVSVKGKLTIHGVTIDVVIPGTIVIAGGKAQLKANFKVKPVDYKIKIPANNAANIAKQIEITVDCSCSK